MKKRLLNFYNFILVVSLLFIGLKTAHTLIDFAFFILLFPVLAYFLIRAFGTFPIHVEIIEKTFRVKKILLIYSTIFCLALLALQIAALTSAKDAFAMFLFAPLFIGFVIEIVAYYSKPEAVSSIGDFPDQPEELLATGNDDYSEVEVVEGVEEVQRRRFFKSMAGAGLGMFLFYIVKPHKAEAAFFGSIPGPGTIAVKDSNGTVIDPAIKLPTDGYGIANVYDTAFSISILYHYYGFTKAGGYWYILRVGSDNSYKYIKGTTDYQTNWTNRESITPYDTFGNTF